MKWLQDNPLGMMLAGISGVFLLLVVALAIVWALPVGVQVADIDAPQDGHTDVVLMAHQIADLSEFQVINQRPVFNESRMPVISLLDGDGSDEDLSVAINGAPEVKLTGVIITPNVRIASLTPTDGNQKSVMAHEGDSLTGEYVGWAVSTVNPRNVVLESRDGDTMELALQIHDATIKEPPKPEPVAETNTEQRETPLTEDGQPQTRAEQIRRRIAERREELRREQEELEAEGGQDRGRQSQSNRQADEDRQAARAQDYQSAIRDMMQNNSKDQASDDG
jgi:hypothetical protein